MSSTPAKSADTSFSHLTPVKFLDSPKQHANNANFISYKTRLDTIIKTLLDDYNKWLLVEKRGLSMCKSIEAIKTRCLEATAKHPEGATKLYPDELKPYCEKLASFIQIFQDIITNAEKALKQLNALAKIENIRSLVFYRTWKLKRFCDTCEIFLTAYKKELELKTFVMHEIAHCRDRADLIRMTSCWEYPQYIGDWTQRSVILLKEEIKSNTKS